MENKKEQPKKEVKKKAVKAIMAIINDPEEAALRDASLKEK